MFSFSFFLSLIVYVVLLSLPLCLSVKVEKDCSDPKNEGHEEKTPIGELKVKRMLR